MKEIRVKRDNLLAVLHENRDRHKDVFEKALVKYRALAIEELERALADARLGKRISRGLRLIEPMNMTRDYDRVIRQVEMDVRDEIELSEREFAQYVMDDWAWRDQFEASTMAYTVSEGEA